MRSLIYVPIIHTSADLGSLAEDVNKRGVADLGEEFWREHKKTVEGFWDAVSLYFSCINGSGVKIYQDGMMADGEAGKRIVEEGVKLGSKNYELISKLLKEEAVLVKTEDFNLVKKEFDRLFAITLAKSVTQKVIALIKYKFTKNRLLDKRDKFIAQRINETLKDGEKGIIFIGAFHDVKKWLSKDIQVKEVKDTLKIKEYHRLLLFHKKHQKRFEELAGYLTAKVEI